MTSLVFKCHVNATPMNDGQCIIQVWMINIIYSNCTVNLEEMHFHDHCQACLICYSDLLLLMIMNTRDPMQNPGQTWIFYKVGQTCLTQAKCDPDNPDDPTWFQPCSNHSICTLAVVEITTVYTRSCGDTN